MANKAHHVVPNSKGGWSVKKSGSNKASSTCDTQKEAINRARVISKNQNSPLIIHRKDGTIRDVRKYSSSSPSSKAQ